MSRALLKGPWCQACRRDVVQSFLAISGISVPPAVSPVRPVYRGRTFSSVPRLRSENTTPASSGPSAIANSTEEGGNITQIDSSESPQHIPWYLQVETPTAAEPHPLAHKQQIPALPENSPPILQDLLEHTFVDIGLDDLALFDLRGLDPPPALGGNVIMIVGTARSVKHLNVSADRLCRWLRSTYKLRPYADGLLGRNELKIKLRRKARRARIASNAGATLENKDDGITTGWICVNAGIVEDSKSVQEERIRDESFEGFGKIAGGTRIIVQIFTEEKRAEVDIEGLWSSALERQGRRNQPNTPKTSPEVALKEVRAPPDIVDRSFSDRDVGPAIRAPATISLEQKRSIHTWRRFETLNSGLNIKTARPIVEPGSSGGSVPVEGVASGGNGGSSHLAVESLFQYVSSLPEAKARDEFGTGPDDHDSTLFLQLFYNRPEGFPAEKMAAAQIKLICMAISVQHPAYSKDRLWEAFLEYASYSDKELALRVLDHLSMQGADVLNMTVFNMLYKAASCVTPLVRPDAEENSDDHRNDRPVRTVHDDVETRYNNVSRVSKVIEALDLPIDPEQARILMMLQFRNGDFDGFWKLWRKIPRHGIRRSSADYEMLFSLHAELGDARRARDCVLAWGPMMEREEPKIALQGNLLRQVVSCIRLADPSVENKALEGSKSTLPMILNRCFTELEREGQPGAETAA